MTTFDLELLQAMDASVFCRENLGIIPDPWQEKVLRYEGKRLILNCCRQSGKSTTAANKGYHRAKYKKRSLILLLSPSLRQSSELFRKVVDAKDRDNNPPQLIEDSKLSMALSNGSRIVSLPGKEKSPE